MHAALSQGVDSLVYRDPAVHAATMPPEVLAL